MGSSSSKVEEEPIDLACGFPGCDYRTGLLSPVDAANKLQHHNTVAHARKLLQRRSLRASKKKR